MDDTRLLGDISDEELFSKKEDKLNILYGQITVDGKSKIGSFRLSYNKWSDRMEYLYFTPKGNKGKGGFTIDKAMRLVRDGKLSLDPKMGDPKNYV